MMRVSSLTSFARSLSLVALASAVASLAAGAQERSRKAEAEPPRPKLEAGRDTNNARHYYLYGTKHIMENPEASAAAFYWAARIDPTWAEPLYARRVALQMKKVAAEVRTVLTTYGGGARRQRTDEQRRLDSLQFRALLRNPFLFQDLDRLLLEEFARVATSEVGELITVNRRSMGDPSYNAWMAYSEGKFAEALKHYAAAAKRYPKVYELRAERARIFGLLQNADSAAAEFNATIENLRKREAKDIVYFYESKAMYEYSIGRAYAASGKLEPAREAFQRALVEDLSFFMAHAALADVALLTGDTAQAISEYALAVELSPKDAALRYGYAIVLLQARQNTEASKQLWAARLEEPYFAEPNFLLGQLYDLAGGVDEALTFYQDFLNLAEQNHPEREFVKGRLAALASKPKPASTPAP